MSYNGSGTFNINTTGQPVVAGTVISSSAFNSLTTDLATGLTTAITKDGQTTTTARITFAQGVTSSLVTDSSSISTGSIITGGGVGIAKALFVGTTANVAGAVTLGGIATFSAQPIFSSLTASSAVATDASKGLVSVTNTGTGNNVLATAPTIASANLTTALTIASASGTVGQVLTSGGSGNAPTWSTVSASQWTTSGADIYYNSGNVLVGTTSNSLLSGPAIKLVGGTNTGGGNHTLLITYSNNAHTFSLRNDGYVTATAIYSLTTASGANVNVDASGFLQRSTSALKYKQDIRDLESIDITKFRPVRYKSKCANDDQELDHFGIVADEVDSVGIKELVSYGLTGDVEGFQYERLTVVLVKAMQEQQATINALTARIVALENA